VSFFGAFVSDTYERDSNSMAVQGKVQDLVELFFVVPLLFLSLIFINHFRNVLPAVVQRYNPGYFK